MEERRRLLPTAKSLVGPILRTGVRIYGRDLTSPFSPYVIAAALHVCKTLGSVMDNSVFVQMWANLPDPVDEARGTPGDALRFIAA